MPESARLFRRRSDGGSATRRRGGGSSRQTIQLYCLQRGAPLNYARGANGSTYEDYWRALQRRRRRRRLPVGMGRRSGRIRLAAPPGRSHALSLRPCRPPRWVVWRRRPRAGLRLARAGGRTPPKRRIHRGPPLAARIPRAPGAAVRRNRRARQRSPADHPFGSVRCAGPGVELGRPRRDRAAAPPLEPGCGPRRFVADTPCRRRRRHRGRQRALRRHRHRAGVEDDLRLAASPPLGDRRRRLRAAVVCARFDDLPPRHTLFPGHHHRAGAARNHRGRPQRARYLACLDDSHRERPGWRSQTRPRPVARNRPARFAPSCTGVAQTRRSAGSALAGAALVRRGRDEPRRTCRAQRRVSGTSKSRNADLAGGA